MLFDMHCIEQNNVKFTTIPFVFYNAYFVLKKDAGQKKYCFIISCVCVCVQREREYALEG